MCDPLNINWYSENKRIENSLTVFPRTDKSGKITVRIGQSEEGDIQGLGFSPVIFDLLEIYNRADVTQG